MATAHFEGYIGNVIDKKSGLILTLCEQIHWDCQPVSWFRLSAWGKVAEAIRPKVRAGKRFRFICTIEIKKKENRTYTNFTVTHWHEVEKKRRQVKSKSARNDDFFVPTIENRDTPSRRRDEGFF